MAFTKREILSPKLTLKLEIELINSSFTLEEATNRLTIVLNNPYNKEFSALIALLLRETASSMWELSKLELVDD